METKQLGLFQEGPEIPLQKLKRPWVGYGEKSKCIRVHLLSSGKLYLEVVKSNPNTGRERWLFDRQYDNTAAGVASMAADMKRYEVELPDYRITEAERFRERHYKVGERLLIESSGDNPIALYYRIGGRLIAPVWSEYEQKVFRAERDFGLERYLDMPALVLDRRYILDRLLMKLSAGYRIFVIDEDDSAVELTEAGQITMFAESVPIEYDGIEE